MPAKSPNPDLLVINTIRTLAMDAVQAANSGHPGTPEVTATRLRRASRQWPKRSRHASNRYLKVAWRRRRRMMMIM
jgi:transketolase